MSVPALGPMCPGDKSVLDHDLTHATSGLALYPAFDSCWSEGDPVIAPEQVKITRHSGGSFSGWSLYATGASGLRYYVTHLRSERASVGSIVPKGGRIGTVGNFVGARVPHAHVGINAEALLGTGRELMHNTNYTHGQPTVGTQLRALPQEDDMTEEFKDWSRWRLVENADPARKPGSLAGFSPSKDDWQDAEWLHETIGLYGEHVRYRGWRDARIGLGPMPDNLPERIPRRWWEAELADRAAFNAYAGIKDDPLEADLRAKLARIEALEAALKEAEANGDGRAAELEAKIAAAVAALS